MELQNTLAKEVSYSGIGLHSGREVKVRFLPAPANTGIIFERTDLSGRPRVPAKAACVTQTMRATTLEEGEAKVFTVEHILAAFSALNIDNCLIEIDSLEPPVADGSALPFLELLAEAGRAEQQSLRSVYSIEKALIVREEKRFISILPYDGFRITFTSVNPHKAIGIQFADVEITKELFWCEIAPARTIGFVHEIETLQAQGLALGGSMENAAVYDENGAVNKLRFTDELVRHKVLDVVGDLALAGPIRGHVVAVSSGHALNTKLSQLIAAARQGGCA
ncbi:UDP-3-O-acyl-N-acetylglucosamine deacetylase [Anaeromusa acidaminophila]|uniref:UDP-3-O-acyl-N-acetylglucosamine deacetylase n=1 Tax=Anaeromusa acidaminophila TaxID=81464 RepID=UPI00037B5C93|nr:UDP-3-O-acyl-N-acetylglucosamine deacetylase [Anaeromusa acidaminophila]